MMRFAKGFKDGIPIGLGYLSVSFAFGIAATQVTEAHGGLTIAQAVLISMTNVTSAGQVAGLELIFAGGSMLETALTQFIINLRYALMSLSLSQKLDADMTLVPRLIFAFCNTDEVFAVASKQPGRVSRRYLYGLMTAPYFGWALGTLLGAAAGTVLPAMVRDALGVAIYGMFIAIVVPPSKREKPVRFAVVAAAALSCLLTYTPGLNRVPGGFAIIICAVAVSALCAALFPIREEGDA